MLDRKLIFGLSEEQKNAPQKGTQKGIEIEKKAVTKKRVSVFYAVRSVDGKPHRVLNVPAEGTLAFPESCQSTSSGGFLAVNRTMEIIKTIPNGNPTCRIDDV